jgi:hypothetical protein
LKLEQANNPRHIIPLVFSAGLKANPRGKTQGILQLLSCISFFASALLQAFAFSASALVLISSALYYIHKYGE